jgi:hypothetical protein
VPACKAFRSGILSHLPQFGYDVNGEYSIHTEYPDGSSRFDILLQPTEVQSTKKGIVFENKIKSFGTAPQLAQYEAKGYDVVVLALLPQTFQEEVGTHYTVLFYNVIVELLHDVLPKSPHPYKFVLEQYREFLVHTLDTYSAISEYCRASLTADTFFDRLGRATQGIEFRKNDIRTFSDFYHYSLAQFIRTSALDLVFGTRNYKDAETQNVNTRWEREKNLQGSPYLEALIHQPFDTPGWTLHSQFKAIQASRPLCIAPRLEVRLNPATLVEKRSLEQEVGFLMLGTWTPEFKQVMKEVEPYKSTLKRRPHADRNFHCETVRVADLPFSQMTQRIRDMMQLIFTATKRPA